MACKLWNEQPTPKCARLILQWKNEAGIPLLHWVLAHDQVFTKNVQNLQYAGAAAALKSMKDERGQKPTLGSSILLCAYNAHALRLLPKVLATALAPLKTLHQDLSDGKSIANEALECIFQLCLQDRIDGYQQFHKCSTHLPNEQGKRLRLYARSKAEKVLDFLWTPRAPTATAAPARSIWPGILDFSNGTRYWRIAPKTVVIAQVAGRKNTLKEAVNGGHRLLEVATLLLPFSLGSGKDYHPTQYYEDLNKRLIPANRWLNDTITEAQRNRAPAPEFHQWLSRLAMDNSNRNALIHFCDSLIELLQEQPDHNTEQVIALVTSNMLTHFAITQLTVSRFSSEYSARWIRLAQRLSPDNRPAVPLNLVAAIL